jgi:hypothetical protein
MRENRKRRELQWSNRVDYQLSARTIVGVLITGYDNDYKQHETNQNLILKNNQIDTYWKFRRIMKRTIGRTSAVISMSARFQRRFKTCTEPDYIYYDNHQPYNYSSAFFNNVGEFLSLK